MIKNYVHAKQSIFNLQNKQKVYQTKELPTNLMNLPDEQIVTLNLSKAKLHDINNTTRLTQHFGLHKAKDKLLYQETLYQQGLRV